MNNRRLFTRGAFSSMSPVKDEPDSDNGKDPNANDNDVFLTMRQVRHDLLHCPCLLLTIAPDHASS